ncbi:TetR-like C-terminal domain-containing protein [Crossiella sp. CA198]|uniref:TetR-like C-terminal domain-containing protein n=1 Tax=Crossiella sp. CA198 TaxID=3455607 RepID=UPI003F8D437E
MSAATGAAAKTATRSANAAAPAAATKTGTTNATAINTGTKTGTAVAARPSPASTANASTASTAADPDTSAGANLVRLAHAIRDWARADPQRYFLIYGTPVPGYHAPEDTTAISAQVMTVLLDACAVLPPTATPATPFDTHLVTHREWADHPAPAATLHRALSFWTRLHGVLSLELAGHFTGMKFDPDLLITDELNALLDQ